ncbi:MAG TPA: LLM class flavin-dependent oxidoreductase [Thermoflexales bacterium]|nr:LLM class flavin-dependent oxidoreductase [Thermoflexales bacterium]
MTIDFGLGMPSRPSKAAMPTWLADLDAVLPHFAGVYDSLWISDHFFWDDNPTIEVWTALSFMAARWPLFKFGPMVLGQSYRNPALMAKMASTLQILTGGRLIFGLGAGWKEDEYHAYNWPFPSVGTRLQQLDEALEIIKRLWTQSGPVTWEGKHYKITNAYLEPKPVPVPPILIGGSGPKLLNIAARHADMWNLTECTLEKYIDRNSALTAECEKIGRDPASIRRTWWGRVIVARTEAEALARGEGKWTRENCILGTPAQVIEQFQAYVAAGSTYFMTIIPGLPDPDIMGMMLDEVLPAVRSRA